MKVDLRILFCGNTNRPDLSVGEFAKKAIPCKLYHDKLKKVVITKYHLNALLLSGLSPSAASMPIVHIMGFDFHLSLLRKVDDFYVLEPVDTVAFPTSHKAIKDNGIQKLISCLEKVKVKHSTSIVQLSVYSLIFDSIEPVPVAEEGSKRKRLGEKKMEK